MVLYCMKSQGPLQCCLYASGFSWGVGGACIFALYLKLGCH